MQHVTIITMSYCRFAHDSDVYVIKNASGLYDCYCEFGQASAQHAGRGFFCDTAAQMLAHLLRHRGNGEKVPDFAVERLLSDMFDELREQAAIEQQLEKRMSLGCVFGSPEGTGYPLVIFENADQSLRHSPKWFGRQYEEGRIMFHRCGHFCGRFTKSGEIHCCRCRNDSKPCKVCYHSQAAGSAIRKAT